MQDCFGKASGNVPKKLQAWRRFETHPNPIEEDTEAVERGHAYTWVDSYLFTYT